MTNKVLYHQGEEIGLRTEARVGGLSLQDDRLVIRGEAEVSIALESLRSVELFRLHGTGRMLKVIHEGGTLFVSVIRFSLFGLFAVVNSFGTRRLHDELQAAILDRHGG
jgi:hypothetical protein